jgi:glycosyltransferase EpsJ
LSQVDVSIIVPVYNSEKYLGRLYESLVGQTHKDIEIIFVDDGSTDESRAILEALKREEPRVRVISTRNFGPSHARNLGLKYAIGKYVCFFDSDDFVEKHMIEVLFSTAQSCEADMVVCGYYIDKYRNSKQIGSIQKMPRSFEKDCVLADIIGGLYIDGMINTLCNKLFRRDIIERFELKMEEGLFLSEDVNFVIDYLKTVQSVAIVHEPLYHVVRRNIDSLTNRYHGNMHEIQEHTLKNMRELFALIGLTTLAKQALATREVSAAVAVIASLFHSQDQRKVTEKLRVIESYMKRSEFCCALEGVKGSNWKEALTIYVLRSRNPILICLFFWLRSIAIRTISQRK